MSNRPNKVIASVSPVAKVGNLLVPPNWRFEAVFNPAKYKLKDFASRNVEDNASCLKRFLNIGLQYDVNYKMSPGIKRLYDGTSPENKSLFLAMWNRHFKRKGVRKIKVQTNKTIFQKSPIWNVSSVKYINDKALRDLVLHYSNHTFDKHIAYALEIGRNQNYTEIFKYIGYCIFAKVPDEKIALRWNIPVKHVEAIREIFFDFSFFPKDRLAMLAHLRQLTNNGLFSDNDFAYYKRVFDLGELGLKAQTDFFSLGNDEKKLVEEFLGKSIVSNVLNLNFSIRTQRDAMEYGAVVSTLSNYYIKNVEKTYFEAKIRNLDAATKRIEGDIFDNSRSSMNEQDLKYMELLTEHSLTDDKIEYKTLDMLK